MVCKLGGGFPHSIATLCHMWYDDSWIHNLLNQSIMFFLLALKEVQLIFKSVAHYTDTVSTSKWHMHSLATYSDVGASTNCHRTFYHFHFKFFSWLCKLLVEHLTDIVDSTNLGSTVTGHVVLKLYFKRLQTVSIIFFMSIIFWS